jgi:hypothetical protein
MINQRLLTASVFSGQILWFSLMFTMLKLVSQTCVPAMEGMEGAGKGGCPAGEVKFARPVLNAFMMIASMSLALVYFYGFVNGKEGVHAPSRKSFIYILLPSALDTVTCALLMAGSMYIPMSLTLTLKGIRVLFSSILVILIFGRKQRGYNWAGVGIAMTGVGLAALSAVLNNSADPTVHSSATGMTIVGICLVLASEFFRALMVVTQEYLIKVVKTDPSFMIGLQGIYGGILVILLMIVAWLVIPGKDVDNSFENMKVTFQLAGESPVIIALLSVLPIVTVLGFVCSAMVTKLLSSVHNAMASVLMTALVWLIEIFIHYCIDSHYGNKWGPYSALQLVGFSFVVLALLIYDGTFLRFPKLFDYPTDSRLVIETKEEVVELESKDDLVNESTQVDGRQGMRT